MLFMRIYLYLYSLFMIHVTLHKTFKIYLSFTVHYNYIVYFMSMKLLSCCISYIKLVYGYI